VFYADHHRAGDIPEHSALEAHINTASNTCTGLIVDYYLKGQYRLWAIVAAYGDNITQVADEYANQEGLSDEQRNLLKKLGVAMNYNGYGNSEDDLYYPPAELFRLASPYKTPFDFIEGEPEVFRTLTEGYEEDMEKGMAIAADRESAVAAMITLPDEAWARRVSGVLGNELANQYPDRAHAILTEVPGTENFMISIRAPKTNANGADVIATHFGGGGRKNAAGINEISPAQIDEFWQMLEVTYA
ncbi:MAG: DHHA1 domain-containing protein, partial [Thalassolituus sp.]